MDPKLQEALQSGQNPFASMIDELKNRQPNNPGQQPANPVAGAAALTKQAGGPSAVGGAAAQPDLSQDPTQPGSNPGTSKPLLQALNALHQFITTASDPSEIALVRSIIVLVTQLVQRDQASQAQKTPVGQ